VCDDKWLVSFVLYISNVCVCFCGWILFLFIKNLVLLQPNDGKNLISLNKNTMKFLPKQQQQQLVFAIPCTAAIVAAALAVVVLTITVFAKYNFIFSYFHYCTTTVLWEQQHVG
jgi:hypothetical protein